MLGSETLQARRRIAGGALSSLAQGLRHELDPLVLAPPEVPTQKALLSRAGGRCAVDGALLRFAPFDPRHLCPTCGREYTGVEHDRFRLYWYQLWLAERVLHAALLGTLLRDDASLRTARLLLDRYADQYLSYPVEDSVLGPSRPFFSTYLESIWLLQLVLAVDLLERSDLSQSIHATTGRLRDRLVEPSLALIASYDEGMSNRQVWNNAALMAAGSLLGRPEIVEQGVHSPSGMLAHLQHGLLADGSWYEGENYHLFAHRGLWYGVQLARRAGHALPPHLEQRYREGFAAPFRTVLPDLTYPSRRDSQYAVSVRQPRFAESLELGLAEHDDPRLAEMLARIYTPDIPRGDTGRASSSADVERNVSATALSRADLSWRSLLYAREVLPSATGGEPHSELLEGQGLAVLRRDGGRVYVSLDYGHSGGGHGHPDRLNLTLMDGTMRWFDDPGTGSYVDRSLHWYRSTLAHNAPLIEGRSQPRVHGRLVAFDERDGTGWVSGEAELMPGLMVRRTLAVMDEYLVDELSWHGTHPHDLVLPFHNVALIDANGDPLAEEQARLPLADIADAGEGFVKDAARLQNPDAVARARGTAQRGAVHRLDGWLLSEPDADWWRAIVPSAPGVSEPHQVVIVRAVAAVGRIVSIWSWREAVTAVERTDTGVRVRRRDGRTEQHSRVDAGWRIESDQGVLLLGGIRPTAQPIEQGVGESGEPPPLRLPFQAQLSELHYRRSEFTWRQAGMPSARVAVSTANNDLLIEVDVAHSARLFVPIDAENPLDNEPAAINGDGVQLYVNASGASGGWLLVPVASSGRVDARPVDGWGSLPVSATWSPTDSGYRMSVRVPIPSDAHRIDLDVMINETTAGRQRRRGQLVLSGAHGEFVYLRGDRHDPSRLIRFSLHD